MKRIIAMVAATAVLLTGCGYLGEESETAKPGAEVQTSEFSGRNVSEINIIEIGGEDGRNNDWTISQIDGRNTVVLTDRMRKTLTYNISDEDFQALTHTDFSNYIGIKADTENIIDAVYYNIEIIYDDGTKDKAEVYIPALWNKLYEIIETSADIAEKDYTTYWREQTMEYELDGMMGFEKLGLYYEVHMAGIDGECFCYNIYFENSPTDEQFEETDKAIGEFIRPYVEKDIYMGYIDVTKEAERLSVYLDLGNVDEENQDPAIKGILTALNTVSGIKSVIVNEDCGFDF